jgi:hypothetical protein
MLLTQIVGVKRIPRQFQITSAKFRQHFSGQHPLSVVILQSLMLRDSLIVTWLLLIVAALDFE